MDNLEEMDKFLQFLKTEPERNRSYEKTNVFYFFLIYLFKLEANYFTIL